MIPHPCASWLWQDAHELNLPLVCTWWRRGKDVVNWLDDTRVRHEPNHRDIAFIIYNVRHTNTNRSAQQAQRIQVGSISDWLKIIRLSSPSQLRSRLVNLRRIYARSFTWIWVKILVASNCHSLCHFIGLGWNGIASTHYRQLARLILFLGILMNRLIFWRRVCTQYVR